MTTEHSQDRRRLNFPEGGKQDSLENPCGTAEEQLTTQLTLVLPGTRTGVTLVRALTHTPTMPPDIPNIHIFNHGNYVRFKICVKKLMEKKELAVANNLSTINAKNSLWPDVSTLAESFSEAK